VPYSVPPSGDVSLSYRGLPYDLLEDLLPHSGAWRQVAPLLMPHDDVATGRPITPLHGGHVGLLCTAGLLNGVFGQGDDRHIARWRSVKHVTTFVEGNPHKSVQKIAAVRIAIADIPVDAPYSIGSTKFAVAISRTTNVIAVQASMPQCGETANEK
jgi:hypothetical protein